MIAHGPPASSGVLCPCFGPLLFLDKLAVYAYNPNSYLVIIPACSQSVPCGVIMDNLELLGKTVLFKGCTKEELELVLGLFQERQVRPNTVIFTEKMAAEAIYIIKSGAVRISVTSPEGEDVQLLFLGPGDFFGELALLQEENRLVNARTVTQSDLLYLSRKDFQALLDLEPQVGNRVLLAIARLLVMRINAYRDKLKEMLLS